MTDIRDIFNKVTDAEWDALEEAAEASWTRYSRWCDRIGRTPDLNDGGFDEFLHNEAHQPHLVTYADDPEATLTVTAFDYKYAGSEVSVHLYADADDDFPTHVGRIYRSDVAHTALASIYFVWRGGGYIDFGPATHSGVITPDDVRAVDTFNVFDYQFDGLLIERSSEGFARWLATFDREDVDRVLECVAESAK